MIAGGFVGKNGRNVHPTAAAGGSLTRLRALRATQMKGCPASSTPSTVATTKGSRHPLRFPTPQYLQHSLQQGRAAAGAAAQAGVGMGWWALRSGCPLLFPHARELYQSGKVCAQVPGSTCGTWAARVLGHGTRLPPTATPSAWIGDLRFRWPRRRLPWRTAPGRAVTSPLGAATMHHVRQGSITGTTGETDGEGDEVV